MVRHPEVDLAVMGILSFLRNPRNQGLTLVPVSAQFELFCPPYNPT